MKFKQYLKENKELITVRPFGRIGSYTKAKQSHRSRPRKGWMIVKFSNEPSDASYYNGGELIKIKKGYIELEGHPTFKTQKAAIEYLKKTFKKSEIHIPYGYR